jgi:hypothetical protein
MNLRRQELVNQMQLVHDISHNTGEQFLPHRSKQIVVCVPKRHNGLVCGEELYVSASLVTFPENLFVRALDFDTSILQFLEFLHFAFRLRGFSLLAVETGERKMRLRGEVALLL